MPRRLTVLLAAVAAVALSAFLIGSARAAPAKKRMLIVGGLQFKAGEYIKVNLRFAPRDLTVAKGDRIVLRDRGKIPEPHSLSLVRRRDLPKSENCRVCQSFFEAHGVNEETGDVANPVVNVGAAGFDRPGDSIVIQPKAKVSFNITADEGTNLHYLCAVHPWMQGKFRVR